MSPMKIQLYDNFLSKKECKFLINYYQKYYENEFNDATYGNTSSMLTLTLDNKSRRVSWLHLRVNLIRWKCLNHIFKQVPLVLEYDQLVHWPNESFLNLHYDRPDIWKQSLGLNTSWTTICYLNDDYSGGETVLDDQKIKPKTGTLLMFNSRNILHGVTPVGGTRYTYASWFQEK